jgi:hypothetical protein
MKEARPVPALRALLAVADPYRPPATSPASELASRDGRNADRP